MANQVDFKILPSDQFSVYSPSTRSDKIITYFTLLSKLRGDILTVSSEEDPNNITSAYYTTSGGIQTLHLVKADGSEVTASTAEASGTVSGTVNYVAKFDTTTSVGDSQIFDDGTNVGIDTTTMTHKLELGTGGVFADYYQLDTSYTNGDVVGQLSWDSADGTAKLGLTNDVTLQIGQEDHWYVKNSTGSTIANGTPVYAAGTEGASGHIKIAPMIADGTIPARFFLGVTTNSIDNGDFGYVTSRGKVRGINTSGYTEGDVLWVSPTVAGTLTTTEPTAPNLKLAVAFALNSKNNGTLAVRAENGQRIADASDVNYTGALDNSFLVYNATNGVWEDEIVGIFKTVTNGTTAITASSYTDTLTITGTAPVTVTNTASTKTIDISVSNGNLTEATSSVLTITGGTGAVLGGGTTIQVSQASSTTSGYLSSTDWTTFNGKQDAITLTTTGTSGAATLVGSTLNIPDYTEQYSGTVTSVATTAPITGGTITTTGTIGITQSGAASDGYLSSADWTTFNSKEPALTKGNLTEATSAVLTITGGTGAVIGSGTSIEVAQSSSTTSGYLSSTDWTTFNGKASNSFTTIAVATQTSIVADSATDTLTIAAGTGVSITTDALTDTLTISATGSGGTVTSVATTAPITGGTITGSGTIGITQATTSTDGYLSSTDWNTFNGKQNAITLTTTGTSGAATFISNTLNIPDYTEQYTGTVTSVSALTIGTTGTDLSSTVANSTTTPVITLNVPTASAANRGALSAADWSIFNGKTGLAFKTIKVTGQSDIVADAAEDDLNIAAGTGVTITTNATTDTLTISATGSGGTVTNVSALTIGTTGTDLTSTVADSTTTPVITLNVPTASATNRGALSSTDWTTFNGKQDAITLTTTGTSGAATLVGATLNIPDYTEQYSGTVTSVGITAGTGISVSGGPITSSGSITVTNSDTGSAQNIFKNIAVSGQTNIVADSNNDTLTLAAGTGISITTDDTTDTVTITNTGSPISCFSAYSSTGITLTTHATYYDLDLDTETIKDSSVFTHSTSTDPDEITVLVTGTYEISYSAAMINTNATTNDAAVVNVYIYKNGSSLVTALNTVQNVAHLNTSNYNYYNQIANSYIVSLTANDVIKLVVLPSYLGGAGSSYGVIFGYLGNNNVTIKKLG